MILTIDVGKTNVTSCVNEGDKRKVSSERVTLNEGYSNFISDLQAVINAYSASSPISSVQIRLPFPFDYQTQTISVTKKSRPDFIKGQSVTKDILAGLGKKVDVVCGNDAYFRGLAYSQYLKINKPILAITHGTGVNSFLQYGNYVKVVEIEELYELISGKAVSEDLYARLPSDFAGDFREGLDMLRDTNQDAYQEFIEKIHQNTKYSIHHLHEKYTNVDSFVLDGKVWSLREFSVEKLELDVSVVVISDKQRDDLRLMPLDLPHGDIMSRAEKKLKSLQTTPQIVKYTNNDIYEDVELGVEIFKRIFYAKARDIRSEREHRDIFLAARILSKLRPIFHQNTSKVPFEVAINYMISARQKFIVSFSNAIDSINALNGDIKIGISVPVINESVRASALSDTNPNGENFVINKLLQLEELFADSAAGYKLLFVDDGSSDNTVKIIQEKIESVSSGLEKGSAQIIKITDVLANENPLDIKNNLTLETQRRKGGASMVGAEILSKQGYQLILLSDSDLEIHMGTLGEMVNAMYAGGNNNLVIAFRQKTPAMCARGLRYIYNQSKLGTLFTYILLRNAFVRTYFPHIVPYPDFQTGFKLLRAEVFKDFWGKVENFMDSYDLNILEFALSKGDVINQSIVPVFESRAETKFTIEDKKKKFAFYQDLAIKRCGYLSYKILQFTMYPLNYIISLWKDAIIYRIKLPKAFKRDKNYFLDII